jgi:hypothetical protein
MVQTEARRKWERDYLRNKYHTDAKYRKHKIEEATKREKEPKALERGRKRHWQIKEKAFRIISNGEKPQCKNCGCDDIRALEANHKNGDGYEENRRLSKEGTSLYNEICQGRRKTDDLSILCRPCNAIEYLFRRFKIVRFKVLWV